MQTQEDHSNSIPALNVDSLKVDFVVIQNTCSEKEDSNSETASSKSVKESSLNYKTKDVHAIKYKMSKAKERCMAYFHSLHSHLQVLSKDNLKGTRIEHGFKRAFMSLSGQDPDTFTRTMLLNVDQLQKQLDKDEFQEDGSMTAFWVVQHFRDTLLQHLGNVKKSVAERTRHQRQYERRVNKRQMQTQESKIDTGKALDADLVDTESIRTDSTVQDDSSREGKAQDVTDADDARYQTIYDEVANGVVQLIAECNIFVIGQQHTKQPEIIIQEKVFVIAALKNDLRKLKGNSVDTKFDKTSVLGKLISTADDSKPKPRSNNQTSRSLPIFIGHRFSPKTSAMYEKTSPRSDLRWKPTGRIFKSVGLRWIPTGKLFDSCTRKVDSEPPHGSNVDIPNIHECKQTLDVSAGTSINVQKEHSLDLSIKPRTLMSNDVCIKRFKPRTTMSAEVHQAAETVTTSNELDLLFDPLFDEYFNGENQVVSKSSAFTTTDASNKHQQQPDSTLSTSSTSTLATTVTADENFNL
ncbi:hypothetical protein Tco_0584368 [Tanacetum coccineum]